MTNLENNPKKIASLRNAGHTYPAGNTAIKKVSMTLFDSEIVGLVGANGSGKTTLLKMLSGYIPLTDGYAELSLKPITEYSEKALSEYVNFVEQNPEKQLIGPTVEDELARNCRMMGMKGNQIRNKVTQVLKDLRMEEAREWFLDEISNGERRRVALGLSLLNAPKLLLLDEPLADLDERGIKSTVDFLYRYKQKGTSILISSHKMDELIKITDRMAVLHEGSLLTIGETDSVLRNSEVLKKSLVTPPAIPALCLELEAAGILSFEKCPLDLAEAKAAIQHTIKVPG